MSDVPPDTALPVDVVVVNYNAGALLTTCVSSALQAGAARVIVVDNASNDDSLPALIRSLPAAALSVHRQANNLGFARACNIGAMAANQPYVLFLNPDCIIATDALVQLLEVLTTREQSGMVGGLLLNPDGSEQAGGRRLFPTPRRSFARAFGMFKLQRWFPQTFPDFLLHQQSLPPHPISVEAISGACMLVRRQQLIELGGWDEAYFLHCEDLDLCMRYWRAHLEVVFVPQAHILHHKGTCSQSHRLRIEWYKHRGMLRFYRKFFRPQQNYGKMALITTGVWIRFVLVGLRLGLSPRGRSR